MGRAEWAYDYDLLIAAGRAAGAMSAVGHPQHDVNGGVAE